MPHDLGRLGHPSVERGRNGAPAAARAAANAAHASVQRRRARQSIG
ncbi:hypothetical protein C7S16_0481 [Burkholderia thailandensis]|uniref:Uncharacterized protein n=1 Tax=Burkholderia thailandensis TaxID=57975 RepID=A0AAW9D2L3_BURTH|nr:hypothetical protein [Burkholderia thailandensis]MDW9254516.1 hypothetical protein [Burkholderia thailandensis]